jgi:hypothetical protein
MEGSSEAQYLPKLRLVIFSPLLVTYFSLLSLLRCNSLMSLIGAFFRAVLLSVYSSSNATCLAIVDFSPSYFERCTRVVTTTLDGREAVLRAAVTAS